MIKIVIELECNEKTFSVNAGRIDKYATDYAEKEIGKKYFDKLKETLKNIDIDSLVKECLKDSKKDCKKSLDDLIDLMFEGKEISSKILNEKEEPLVFILWGAYARSKKELITNPKHLIIESAHPSPFSARNGFFGSKPFSRTNAFLKSKGLKEIDWTIE